VGIGLFIALMGLINAGIIQSNENTVVALGDMSNPSVWIAFIGLVVIGVLLILRIKGALLIGIFSATIAGIFLKEVNIPESNIIGLPPDISPIFLQLDFKQLLNPDIIIVLFTFLFVDMFDTVGTLVGVCSKANMLDKKGNVPKAKSALFADSIATTCGALLGTSTVTTYVESAAGVVEGGRTGLTAVVVAVLFFITLFLSPIFLMIPSAATGPALVMVGLFMISPIRKIDLEDYAEAIPAFLTILIMPLAFSISEGITFGILSYVILKVLTGNFRKVSIVLYILSLFFILRFIF
jgi:AGZA family xanthine/uracil permease-like MFS transporter